MSALNAIGYRWPTQSSMPELDYLGRFERTLLRFFAVHRNHRRSQAAVMHDLIAMGFAEVITDTHGRRTLSLTDAGIAALTPKVTTDDTLPK